MKDETTFRYAHAGIRTRVVVICGPARYRYTTEAPQIIKERENSGAKAAARDHLDLRV